MNKQRHIVAIVALALLASAASAPGQEDDLRQRFGLQPLPPLPYPENNPYNPDRVELGRLLFFDPILSGEKDTACGTCHLPTFGMADGLPLAVGVGGKGLGPERVTGRSAVTGDTVITEPRHTMTLFNVGYNGDESGLPSTKGFMLWDGKDRGLEAQALRPLIVRVELRGDAYEREMAVDSVLTRLRGIPEYVALFEQAFPAEADSVARQLPRLGCAHDPTPLQSVITRSTFGRAIAAFEREQNTVNTAYDRYVAGDAEALTPAQKRGLELFHTKARCVNCHSGPLFTDSSFRVQGVEQIGPGRASATTNTGTPRPTGKDEGRFLNSGNRSDIGAFRVVGLRQIVQTAPYMHDGALATLEDVIEFYDRGGGDEASVPAENIDPELVPLNLSAEEKQDLLAFMHALTDSTIAVHVPARVPSGLPPAGLELAAEAGLVVSVPAPSAQPVAVRVFNFPNPFNASTSISVALPEAGEVDIEVYNILGQSVRRLFRGYRPAGVYQLTWDGRDEGGWEAASGVYLVSAQMGGTRYLARMTLVR